MLVLQKDCSLGKGFLFQWSFFKLVDDWTSLAFNCKIIVDKYWWFIGSLYIGWQDNCWCRFQHRVVHTWTTTGATGKIIIIILIITHENKHTWTTTGATGKILLFHLISFLFKTYAFISFKMHIFSFVWLNFEMFTFVLKLQFLTFINFWFNVIIGIRYSSSEIWKWRHWFVQFWYFSGWICSLYGRGKQPGEGKYSSRDIGAWSLQNNGQNQEYLNLMFAEFWSNSHAGPLHTLHNATRLYRAGQLVIW